MASETFICPACGLLLLKSKKHYHFSKQFEMTKSLEHFDKNDLITTCPKCTYGMSSEDIIKGKYDKITASSKLINVGCLFILIIALILFISDGEATKNLIPKIIVVIVISAILAAFSGMFGKK